MIWHDVERELLTKEQAEKLLTDLSPAELRVWVGRQCTLLRKS